MKSILKISAKIKKNSNSKKKAPKPWEKNKKKPKCAKSKDKKSASKNKPQDPSGKQNEFDAEDHFENNSDLEEVTEDEEKIADLRSEESQENQANLPRSRIKGNAKESGNNDSSKNEEYFEKFQQMQKKREKLEAKAKISHRVYCPFFPEVKQECWWLYVADRKNHSVLTAPIYICSLKDSEEIEIKFLAPKIPGLFTYTIVLRSDSYLDFDVSQNIKLEVLPAKKVEEHPQWNFTDDEEVKEGHNDENDDEYDTESEFDD